MIFLLGIGSLHQGKDFFLEKYVSFLVGIKIFFIDYIGRIKKVIYRIKASLW